MANKKKPNRSESNEALVCLEKSMNELASFIPASRNFNLQELQEILANAEIGAAVLLAQAYLKEGREKLHVVKYRGRVLGIEGILLPSPRIVIMSADN